MKKLLSALLCLCLLLNMSAVFAEATLEETESSGTGPFLIERLPDDSGKDTPGTEKQQRDPDYSFQSDYDGIEQAANSIFYVEIYDAEDEYLGSASGFVAFEEHLFVTNFHVIEDACYLVIWDEQDNYYFLDEAAAVDKNNDLAILSFPEGKDYEPLDYQLNAALKRGQPVTTIGSPQGMQNTVAFGNISAFPRIEGRKMIQFTAPISHGSSGGVLFDDNGKVIGITTAIISEGENIGFAVPVDELLQLYAQWDKTSYDTIASVSSNNWDDFFLSMEGRIAFTFPCVPDVYHEADLDVDDLGYVGWKNKLQFWAETKNGGEFMVHIGDLTPAMDRIRADYPGEDEKQYQMNALMNMAEFYLGLYDGEVTDEPEISVYEVEGETYLDCRFTFSYPDKPGVAYQARGIMEGAYLVLMMVEEDPDALRILEKMQVVTEAEAEAHRDRQPMTVTVGDMRVTFPVPADTYVEEDGSISFADAFTPNYAYLSVDYLEYPIWSWMDGEDPNEYLEDFASEAAADYQAEGELEEYTVKQVADSIFLIDGLYPAEDMTEAQGRLQIYFTLNGLYMVECLNDEEGQAFLDSIVIPAAAE